MYSDNFNSPVFETEIRVRYAETDKMSVVYYGNYFTWFEVARGDVLRKAGYPYSKLEEDGIMLPVIEAYSKYIAPVKYDDLICVMSKIEKFGPASISFIYEIYKLPEKKLCTEGYTRHAILGSDGKLIKHDKDGIIDKIKQMIVEYKPEQ